MLRLPANFREQGFVVFPTMVFSKSYVSVVAFDWWGVDITPRNMPALLFACRLFVWHEDHVLGSSNMGGPPNLLAPSESVN